MTPLAPMMLFGLLLAAAPIIIHLLNRRRFIRVDWAPMEYLKLTLKANRRRLRLEQLLLLAVRTLIVVALVLALARFVAQRDSLAGFLTARARTSRIVVIDDSLSMGYNSAGKSALDRAKEAASRILHATGPKDSLTLLSISQPDVPLLRQAQVQETDDLTHAIDALQPAHLANNWKSTFDQLDQHLESALFPIKEVIVITDLKSEGWSGELIENTDEWAREGVKVFVVDVGAPAQGNVALESLTQMSPLALVGDPVTLLATLRNDGAQTLTGLQTTLSVDDAPRPLALPDLPPNESVEVPLTLAFDQPGEHRVDLALPSDLLPGDNRRYAVIEVKEALHLLLVDGEPGRRAFDGETDFLALALSVGRSPWQVTQITDAEWLDAPLTAPDVLVLANVASIPATRAGELEELVSSGMGLLVFPGEQLDPVAWNDQLARGGQGLLPAAIAAILDQEVRGLVLESTWGNLPIAQLSPPSLARIQPKRLVTLANPDALGENVRVLARWNDAQNSPALLEKSFGSGKVLFWTVTADKAWSEWPTEASYVLAVRQSVELLAGRPSSFNIIAGTPTPALPSDSPDTTEPAPASAPVDLNPTAGFHQITWTDPVTGEHTRTYSVSPDARESQLQPLSRDRLNSLLGAVDWELVPFNGEQQALGAQGAELWRSFILALMSLIAIESVLAAWVGRPK